MTTVSWRWRQNLLLVAIMLMALTVVGADRARSAEQCEYVGGWVVPGKTGALASNELIAGMVERPVVLLGEIHDSAEDHRWQLHTLAALHALNPNMVIGFEMFPRSAQPVLDRWIAGELSVSAFLKESKWDTVWGYDAALYLPIFHFARQHRIPMRAINVERQLISKVGRNGWEAVPQEERGGIGDPAGASEAYRKQLNTIFAAHGSSDDQSDEGRAKRAKAFENFVDAQLTWDRAMAEGLSDAHHANEGSLIVGIIGRGHLEFGFGISHQLSDLGIADSAVLLTEKVDGACPKLEAGVADAVFLLGKGGEAVKAAPYPRLGVMIEGSDKGVRVVKVVGGSVADTATLQDSDLIVSAAGTDIKKSSELVEIVRRQAPGTWLPLIVQRGDEMLGIVARFPALQGKTE